MAEHIWDKTVELEQDLRLEKKRKPHGINFIKETMNISVKNAYKLPDQKKDDKTVKKEL